MMTGRCPVRSVFVSRLGHGAPTSPRRVLADCYKRRRGLPGPGGSKVLRIPLTEDERDAVNDGQAALDKLLERLCDTPPRPVPHRGNSAPRGQANLLRVIAISRTASRK